MIVITSDHSGMILKNEIKEYLKMEKIEFVDLGPDKFIKNDDYPDFVHRANTFVLDGNIGIYICASGIGVSMAANHTKGIRAVNAVYKEHAYWARHHEDANVLCLGQNFVAFDSAKDIIKVFLNEKFDGGRHLRRINKY